ncbi:esterase E4-like [Diprion similis]|uniref:esterase E4-like n=1 Tax=Diprion similis TaxID=362088 RepID=UPI001EF9809B|nr:esterase E4-like [Diprion similis]
MGFHGVKSFCGLILLLNALANISDANARNILTTSARDTAPQVTILQGPLEGTTVLSLNNRTIYSFLGIPYAQPPIGNLRFSNPVAAGNWTGTFNATVDGEKCLQYVVTGSEDCLYLNVYTPQLPGNGSSSLLPVMVSIHGGGFAYGSGDFDGNGPAYLLDVDVVLVTMNYRLGVLGFLSTGDEVAPGNWGLKDQVLSLEWVRDNIAFFGGDPNQVTIMGNSAGAVSVHMLALSDLARGLFHKYIAQSGSASGFWAYQPSELSAQHSHVFGGYLNCDNSTSTLLIQCLRGLNVSTIMLGDMMSGLWNTVGGSWSPTIEPDIEGALLTDSPLNLVNAGKMHDLPSISGSTRDEAATFVAGYVLVPGMFDQFLADIDNALPNVLGYSRWVDDVPAATAALKDFYFPDLTADRSELLQNLTLAISDTMFIYPGFRMVQMQNSIFESDQFFYSFDYRGIYSQTDMISSAMPNNSAAHADEMFYLFPQTEAIFGAARENMTVNDRQMVDTMMELWTSFAITGIPTTTTGGVTWQPFATGNNNYLRIGSDSDPTVENLNDFQPERMQLWSDLLVASSAANSAIVSSPLRWILICLVTYFKML